MSLSLSLGSEPSLDNYFTSHGLTSDLEGLMYYDDSQMTYRTRMVSTPTFNLGFGYRWNSLISLEIIASYASESSDYYDLYNDAYRFTCEDRVMMITPTLKAHWLNRGNWSLYSSFGIGLAYASHSNLYGIEGNDTITAGSSLQFNLVGATYSLDRLFAFGELGVGTIGITRFGIGYKF